MILLDTCAVLWLAEGSDRISKETLAVIDKENIVTVSSISAFEISLKYRKGKLGLPLPPEEWWERIIAHHRLDVIDLSPSILIRSTMLPEIHKDPADRFIIATAMKHNCRVVTADQRFSEYGIGLLI